MQQPIAYYVHHQGAGHLDRARLIGGSLKRPCTLMGTIDRSRAQSIDVLQLPDDALGVNPPAKDCMPRALHFAPIQFAPVRDRMGMIADWIVRNRPALAIVDVSVEVAFLFRLLSVPVITMRLAGDRSDTAHLETFRLSHHVIAPFPPSFDHPANPTWVRAKTRYAGFLHEPPAAQRRRIVPGTIGVVLGSGGPERTAGLFIATARALPGWQWHVFGPCAHQEDKTPANLVFHGFVDAIDTAVEELEVLVGAAGDGMLSLAVRQAKQFVCLPEARPYDEQFTKAHELQKCGAAVVRTSWPTPSEWPAVLEKAARLDLEIIRSLQSDHALHELAAFIEKVASQFDS